MHQSVVMMPEGTAVVMDEDMTPLLLAERWQMLPDRECAYNMSRSTKLRDVMLVGRLVML